MNEDILNPQHILAHMLRAYFTEVGFNDNFGEVVFIPLNTTESFFEDRVMKVGAGVKANVFITADRADKDVLGPGNYEYREYNVSLYIESVLGDYIIQDIIKNIKEFSVYYRDGSLFKGFICPQGFVDWEALAQDTSIKDILSQDPNMVTHRSKFWQILKKTLFTYFVRDKSISLEFLAKRFNIDDITDLNRITYELVRNSIEFMQDIVDVDVSQETNNIGGKNQLTYKINLIIRAFVFLKTDTERFK